MTALLKKEGAVAKKHARERIDAKAVSQETQLLLKLDEAIDERRVLKSKANEKKFFETFSAILKNKSPKFDVVRKVLKDNLLPFFIYQLRPWTYAPEILCLEDLNIVISNQALLKELQDEVLNKYSETPIWKDYLTSLFGLMDTIPFSVLVGVFIVSRVIPDNALTGIASMLCSPSAIPNTTLTQEASDYNVTRQNSTGLFQQALCNFTYIEESTNYTVVDFATVVVVVFYILRVIFEVLKIFSDVAFSKAHKSIDSELEWLVLYFEVQSNSKISDAFATRAQTIIKKVLSKSIRFKNIFNDVLNEFKSISRFGEELNK